MDCNHPCEGLTFYGHTTEGARQHGWATLVALGAKEVTTAQIDSECSNRVRVIFWSSSPNRADLAGEPRQRGRPRSPAHRSSKQRIPHPGTKRVRQRLARTRAGIQERANRALRTLRLQQVPERALSVDQRTCTYGPSGVRRRRQLVVDHVLSIGELQRRPIRASHDRANNPATATTSQNTTPTGAAINAPSGLPHQGSISRASPQP